ncbi:MAG: NADP-dependent malic enzyme [Planctomycetes bacterium]|nr:NADP-dependent malic enzyme [Planctomycetota bacterium]
MARNLDKDALEYHEMHRPGKVEIRPTKPCVTQRDLSLAYSPGVAAPCLEIAKDPSAAFRYTARGNLVAVISNGTAVLGLGDIGPLAGKPVMEGKGILFKKFADIDVFDIEVDEKDVSMFCEVVKRLEPTFGGINLEDIKGPECFEIEERLKAEMGIPVFHDDQHGTAIISTAAILNAMELTGKDIRKIRAVICGAGAAGISCGEMMVMAGVRRENVLMTDSKGVIHADRDDLNKYKAKFAPKTKCRTLEDAMKGADVFLGLSKANMVTKEMVKSMAAKPVILAMANPVPEILPEEARAARSDAIIGTGRSDYPNQVNNVLGFPFIFRGALDVKAKQINEEMKMAAAKALAELTKQEVPDAVKRAYGVTQMAFGPDYIIPKPFDPRVLTWVAPAVAKAACDTGVAMQPIADWDQYRDSLAARVNRGKEAMRTTIQRARREPRRIVFPEAHEDKVLQACELIVEEGVAVPVLVGDEAAIRRRAAELNVDLDGVEIADPTTSPSAERHAELLWSLRQRKGVTPQRARRDVRQPHVFASLMLRAGEVEGMVAGVNRSYSDTIRPLLQIVGLAPDAKRVSGMYMLALERRALFFADATVNIDPDAQTLAEIAVSTGRAVRDLFNTEPRVAMLSFSNFGSVEHPFTKDSSDAVRIARALDPTLVIDGEMAADTALVPEIAKQAFPMSAIQGDANVLVFPDLQAGNIAYKLVQHLAGAEVIGPMLLGLAKPANVLNHYSTVEEIVNIAAITVIQARRLAARSAPAKAGPRKAPAPTAPRTAATKPAASAPSKAPARTRMAAKTTPKPGVRR